MCISFLFDGIPLNSLDSVSISCNLVSAVPATGCNWYKMATYPIVISLIFHYWFTYTGMVGEQRIE